MSTPPLPPPLPPPPTEADLEDLERFAKRRGVRASLGSGSGSARSKDASARTKQKGRKENRKGLTKKVTKAAIEEALSANYASGAVPRKKNAMDSKVSPAKDSALEQKHRESSASVPPPPPPPPLPPAAAPPVPPQMPSALHIHNVGLSDFEYESKDDASQLSSPRSRSWTGEDSMGGHEQKDEVLHNDDPPPLPPLPTTLEDEEAVTPFEIPSPPAALPDMPSPVTNVDNVPPPPPPLQDYEDPQAPELSLSSELPSQASKDIYAHKPKPPHLPPPAMPEEMSEVGAEGPQEDMNAIFAQLRRKGVPSTTNEAVVHGVISTQGQKQDESLEQRSYVATNSELSTIETDLADRRVLNPSPMPAEPPQEGMSAIFAQLRRNRVPSTTNEAVIHGVAGMQQREHDEPPDQTPVGLASTEPEVSSFETGPADRRVVTPSSMPTEPPQEGMSAIFAQLRRNRVPSTTDEAVVHGVAKIQQRQHEDSFDLNLSNSVATKPYVPPAEASTTAETKSHTTTESNEHHLKQMATDLKTSSMTDGLEKYRTMLKAGLAEGAVRHALARDGKQVPVDFFGTDPDQPSCEADDVSIDDDRVSEAGSVQSSTSARSGSTTGSLRRLASLRRLSQQRKSSRSLIHEAEIESYEQEDGMSDEASSEAALHEDDNASVKADADLSAGKGVGTKARGNSTEHRLAQVLEVDEVEASAGEMVTDAATATTAIPPPPPPPPPEGAAEKKENAEKEMGTSDAAALSVQNTAAATAATPEREVKEERKRAIAAAATTVGATAEVAAATQQQHHHKSHKQQGDVETSTAASGKEDVTISLKAAKDLEVSPKTALESNGAAEASIETEKEREVLLSVEEETELLAQLEAARAVKRKEEAERAERARQSAREQEFRSALVFRRTRELEQIGFMTKGHAQELNKAFEDVKDADLESFDALSKLATKRQVIMETCLEQVRSKPLAEGRAGLFGSVDERPRSFSTGFVRRRKPSVHEHDPVELLNKVSHVALKADVAQENVSLVLRECAESRERIHALQQRIVESENIMGNARIPEDALRSKLAELEAVHRLQRSLQDAEFHTLEKRCEEVAKRIGALGREEKARILDAAERKSAKALGAVRRNLRDSKQRLASEHAQDLAALEEKSKGVDAAMQRKTTAEFRRVLSRQVDVLKEKRALVETQIAERKHERTLAEREAAVLARDLQQHLLPPVSTRAEADAHIDKLRDQHATTQRKKMDRLERELSLGWSKMRGLGLSEEQAKHKLILLRKLEACIVASPKLVHIYQNMLRKLQEAVPILLAEQELGRLERAVETSAEVLESSQVNETAEKEALRAINRLSDAMRELRTERDARRVHWEREHGALPPDWHASQDIE